MLMRESYADVINCEVRYCHDNVYLMSENLGLMGLAITVSACGLKTAGDRKIASAALVRRAIHPMHARGTPDP
jgi:hypothetical protein